jgi:2-amino-4-hydroxy-6-hydroxymethyldihydropteridine diphosphokinase
MKSKKLVVIALGSNLGERQQNLSRGLMALRKAIDIEKCSNIYGSKAVLPDNAPKDWDSDFYNCVFCGKTELGPQELLELCIKAEQEAGQRDKGSGGPRFLDIDIIAYGDEVIDTEKLKIPHPKMLERSFVLIPLAEILPDWVHPVEQKKIRQILKEADFDNGKIKKLDMELL